MHLSIVDITNVHIVVAIFAKRNSSATMNKQKSTLENHSIGGQLVGHDLLAWQSLPASGSKVELPELFEQRPTVTPAEIVPHVRVIELNIRIKATVRVEIPLVTDDSVATASFGLFCTLHLELDEHEASEGVHSTRTFDRLLGSAHLSRREEGSYESCEGDVWKQGGDEGDAAWRLDTMVLFLAAASSFIDTMSRIHT